MPHESRLVRPGVAPRDGPDDLERLERFVRLLDARYRVPGTSFRVGLDGLIGLVPGVGDVLTTLLSLAVLAEARRRGVGRSVLVRMAGNLAVDFLVGAVPLAGDAFDMWFKANVRNLELLKRALAAKRLASADRPPAR